MFKDYKITFGGQEYILNSANGGLSGSIFEPGADRSVVSYAYLWAEPTRRVSRFGKRLAEGDEIVVDLESATDAEDNSMHDGGLESLMAILDGWVDRADADDEPYYCGECEGCLAAAKESN
jgi:hypothetical protein